VSVTEAVCLSDPEVPVIVNGYCPGGTLLAAVKVIKLEPKLLSGLVPKEAVTPVGRPDSERVTFPAKPF
jgi:hypothetical protein